VENGLNVQGKEYLLNWECKDGTEYGNKLNIFYL